MIPLRQVVRRCRPLASTHQQPHICIACHPRYTAVHLSPHAHPIFTQHVAQYSRRHRITPPTDINTDIAPGTAAGAIPISGSYAVKAASKPPRVVDIRALNALLGASASSTDTTAVSESEQRTADHRRSMYQRLLAEEAVIQSINSDSRYASMLPTERAALIERRKRELMKKWRALMDYATFPADSATAVSLNFDPDAPPTDANPFAFSIALRRQHKIGRLQWAVAHTKTLLDNDDSALAREVANSAALRTFLKPVVSPAVATTTAALLTPLSVAAAYKAVIGSVRQRLQEHMNDLQRQVQQQEDQAKSIDSEHVDDDLLSEGSGDNVSPLLSGFGDAESEAAERLKLQENVIDKWRGRFGERVGDDYELDEEEVITEDEPLKPPPPPKKPPIAALKRAAIIDKQGRAFGKGNRKSSIAQVWIKRGVGHVTVNRINHAIYFDRIVHRAAVMRPFLVTNTLGQFDVVAFTSGGGKTGQSDAIKLGVARALAKFEPELRPILKKDRLLTVDIRRVERKKFGQPKARKQWAFVKR